MKTYNQENPLDKVGSLCKGRKEPAVHVWEDFGYLTPDVDCNGWHTLCEHWSFQDSKGQGPKLRMLGSNTEAKKLSGPFD